MQVCVSSRGCAARAAGSPGAPAPPASLAGRVPCSRSHHLRHAHHVALAVAATAVAILGGERRVGVLRERAVGLPHCALHLAAGRRHLRSVPAGSEEPAGEWGEVEGGRGKAGRDEQGKAHAWVVPGQPAASRIDRVRLRRPPPASGCSHKNRLPIDVKIKPPAVMIPLVCTTPANQVQGADRSGGSLGQPRRRRQRRRGRGRRQQAWAWQGALRQHWQYSGAHPLCIAPC